LLARPLAPAVLRRRSHADAVDPASDGRPAVEIAEAAVDDDENLLTHVGHVGARDAELRQDAPDEPAASLEDFVEIGRRRDRRIVARVESFRRTDLHASHWRRLAEFLDQNKCPTPKYPPPPTADIWKTPCGGLVRLTLNVSRTSGTTTSRVREKSQRSAARNETVPRASRSTTHLS